MSSDIQISAGRFRLELAELCQRGEFVVAYMKLNDSGIDPSLDPGPWEYLARQMDDAGLAHLATEIRVKLSASGIQTGELTLAEARGAIGRDDHRRAQYILERFFGDTPDPDEARMLLAIAKADSDPEAALELLDDIDIDDADTAVQIIDIMRNSNALNKAGTMAAAMRRRFPDSDAIQNRQARIFESLSDWEAALATWEPLTQRTSSTRSLALLNVFRLNQRLERHETAHQMAALHLLSDAPLSERLILLNLLDQNELMVDVLATAVIAQKSRPLHDRQWVAASDVLVDQGRVGLLKWLAQKDMPVGAGAETVLSLAGNYGRELRDGFTNINAAAQVFSPDFLLPTLAKAGENRLPADWLDVDPEDATILLVNSTLAAGGAERQLIMLVKSLLNSGVTAGNLHVGLLSDSADRGHAHFMPELIDLGVPVHVMETQRDRADLRADDVLGATALLPTPLRPDVVALSGLVQKIRPQILHGWQDRAALVCGWVGTALGVDQVVMSARNMAPDQRTDRTVRSSAPLFRALRGLPNVRLTANSKAGAADYERWLGIPEGQVTVLNNGVDLEAFNLNRKPAATGESKRKKVNISGVFRLAANKRPELWLQTVAELRKISEYEICPRIVGNGPFLDRINVLQKELGLEDLQLAQSLSDPNELFGGADVVLLMSRVEGTPNVLIEAQACGVAVAACDVGGVRNAMFTTGAGAGLLMEPDITAQEAAIRINDWLKSALGDDPKTRRAFVEQNFSLATLAHRARALYSGEKSAVDEMSDYD